MVKYIILAVFCVYGCGEAIDSSQTENSIQESIISVDSASSTDDVTSNGDATTDG